mmetsp:Transcript_46093/g.128390  ORF Transcript_46093/g.128390 Transcript_46093/m.128390 type:complete len:208 (+) Transcript_46093:893-1516(+)
MPQTASAPACAPGPPESQAAACSRSGSSAPHTLATRLSSSSWALPGRPPLGPLRGRPGPARTLAGRSGLESSRGRGTGTPPRCSGPCWRRARGAAAAWARRGSGPPSPPASRAARRGHSPCGGAARHGRPRLGAHRRARPRPPARSRASAGGGSGPACRSARPRGPLGRAPSLGAEPRARRAGTARRSGSGRCPRSAAQASAPAARA